MVHLPVEPSGLQKRPTLIIVCSDGRSELRRRELYDYYLWLDGVEPFTISNAGAGNVFEGGASYKLLHHNRLLFKQVRHVRVEHHAGTPDLTIHGCAQYRDLYERSGTEHGHAPGILYPPTREREDHLQGLRTSVRLIREYYETDLFDREMTRRDVSFTTSLFRFTARTPRGYLGEEEIVYTERELPSMPSELLTGAPASNVRQLPA